MCMGVMAGVACVPCVFCGCVWTKLQTLLAAMELAALLVGAVEGVEEEAADAEEAAATAADAAAEVAAEKCCARVDTNELPLLVAPALVELPEAPDPDDPAAAGGFFDMPAFDESDNEEVEDCDPKGEETIRAAAAELAPPP